MRDLAAAMRGVLLCPGDGGYEAARRVWNGAVDRPSASGPLRARGRLDPAPGRRTLPGLADHGPALGRLLRKPGAAGMSDRSSRPRHQSSRQAGWKWALGSLVQDHREYARSPVSAPARGSASIWRPSPSR